MTENQLDLSKLKIKREEEKQSGPHEPPHKPHFAYFMYFVGVIFLGIAIYYAVRNIFVEDPIVEITTVSYISPAQADAILTASGYVVAQRKAAIASKATGRLVYLGFKEGDKVKEGQIIARIESADVEAALTQAKAEYDVAQADKVEAEQSYERAKKLLDQHLISQAEFDIAKSRFDRVTASIASRSAAVKAAEVQMENTRIRAPFDGTILTKNADIGEVVAPFAAGASSRVAVVTIADMNSLEVEADVSESNIERIQSELPCEITLDAYPDKRYRGVVDKIVPTADRAKATVMTKIRFVEKDSRVLPEMSAKVHFLKNKSKNSINITPMIAVDPAVITKRKDEIVAFVLKGQIIQEVTVVTGNKIGSLIEVKSGLNPGDKVILHPNEKLQSGASVKLRE
ncbi:MAG: efflux RND transporter periplasmic adaptor subunit [Ignavibacteriales bacterium]|nr:efflux RND transporter periplasmic adaptor subunit [Ignavibacteriales bacterium]